MECMPIQLVAPGRAHAMTLIREATHHTASCSIRHTLHRATHTHAARCSACQRVSAARRMRVTASSASAAATTPVEVEVKIRLPTKKDHDKVLALLKDSQRATYAQENFFFDGANQELSCKQTIVRVRLYNGDEKATLTVKGKGIVKDGISRLAEQEEAIAPEVARKVVADPNVLVTLDSPIFKPIVQAYNISGMRGLGGFKNVRKEFAWEGYTLEVDETLYEWGTLYELEVETEEPEAVREKLEQFCKANGIQHSYSKVSKFANFINRRLD